MRTTTIENNVMEVITDMKTTEFNDGFKQEVLCLSVKSILDFSEMKRIFSDSENVRTISIKQEDGAITVYSGYTNLDNTITIQSQAEESSMLYSMKLIYEGKTIEKELQKANQEIAALKINLENAQSAINALMLS